MGVFGDWRKKRKIERDFDRTYDSFDSAWKNSFSSRLRRRDEETVKNKMVSRFASGKIGKLLYEPVSISRSWNESSPRYKAFKLTPVGLVLVTLLLFTGFTFLALGLMPYLGDTILTGTPLLAVNAQPWAVFVGAVLVAGGFFVGLFGCWHHVLAKSRAKRQEDKEKGPARKVDAKLDEAYEPILTAMGKLFSDLPRYAPRMWCEHHLKDVMEVLSFGCEDNCPENFDDPTREVRNGMHKLAKPRKMTPVEEYELDARVKELAAYAERVNGVVAIWGVGMELTSLRVEWDTVNKDEKLGALSRLGEAMGLRPMLEAYYDGVPLEDVCC